MIKKLVYTLFIVLLLISCSSGYEISKSMDPNNPGSVVYSTPRMQVKSNYKSQEFYTFLQFTCFVNDGSKTYLMSSSYSGNNYPDLERVVFYINGIEEELIPERASIKEIEGVLGKTETMMVKVSENLIINLYEEDNILMSIVGQDIQYDVRFTENIRQKLKEFHDTAI